MTEAGYVREELHFSDRVVRCFAQRPASLAEKLEAVFQRCGRAIALVDVRGRWQYEALDERIEACAALFWYEGLRSGDRVGLLIPNRAEFVIALLAAWRIGAVPVPLNVREAPPEIAFILSDCGAKGLVWDPAHAGAVPGPDETPSLSWRLDVDAIREGREAGPGVYERGAAEADATICILYTSGTTGRPKGAMLTDLGILHSLMHYERHFGVSEADCALLVVPATHVTGLVGLVMATLGAGGKLVMMERFDTATYVGMAVRERMSFTIMVPAMYNLLLRRENLARHDLSHWRLGAYGGAVMAPEAIAALAQLLPSLTLANAYGATETTSPASLTPLGSGLTDFETVGRPVACAEILVMDDEGRACPPGVAGELWIRGPMVVPGYWNRPEANAREFVAGYWRSGDVGELTATGALRIHDRKKDLVNRGGYKIFSAEVESVLLSHDDVLEAAVVPVPCPVLGERVHAFVTLRREHAKVDADALRVFCARALSDYKVPEIFTLSTVPLPRNANGKLLKRDLRETLKIKAD